VVRGTPVDEAASLAALYAAAASAEEDAADALLPAVPVARTGAPGARLLLVKGAPGPEDERAGAGPAGPDADAVLKALARLVEEGAWPAMPDDVLGVVTRPAAGTAAGLAAARLARYLEAADPALAVALDETAAADLAVAAGLRALPFGEPAVVAGRTLLAVDGMEASLSDPERKKRVWAQLKSLGAPKRPK
jgi:hypothetical protein